MPKKEVGEKNFKSHKIMMGIAVIIFSIVLYMSSSETALEANLNWSGAFFILGVLLIIKALFFRCC